PADVHDQACWQREVRLLSRFRYADAAAEAAARKGDPERRGLAQEIRDRQVARRAGESGDQQAAASSARRERWRRSASRWRQALDVERRSRVADACRMGEG